MPSIEDLEMEVVAPVRILVIGGSYGGLATALNLSDLCAGRNARFHPGDEPPKSRYAISVEIKIVDERDGYYHLIGSPLALASKEYALKAWTRFVDLPALHTPEISFTQGSVISVDCEEKKASIRETGSSTIRDESYDFLVASTGLRRAWPVVPQSLKREEYVLEVNEHIERVKNAREGVVVIGGGAVGIEMAAELKMLEPQQAVTLIHSRERLLSSEPLSDEFKDRSLLVLQEAGVNVMLHHRVTKVDPVETDDGSPLFMLTMGDGSELITSHVIMAISNGLPASSYLPEIALDVEGYVKIGPTLNLTVEVPNARQHFAVGDLVAWSGIRRCGGAMYMGFVTAVNIYQQIIQEQYGKIPQFEEIPEFEPMIALAIGDKAVVYSPTDGTSWGEDQMKIMFGNDLGFTICWNYLKLGNDVHNPPKVAF